MENNKQNPIDNINGIVKGLDTTWIFSLIFMIIIIILSVQLPIKYRNNFEEIFFYKNYIYSIYVIIFVYISLTVLKHEDNWKWNAIYKFLIDLTNFWYLIFKNFITWTFSSIAILLTYLLTSNPKLDVISSINSFVSITIIFIITLFIVIMGWIVEKSFFVKHKSQKKQKK